MNREEIKDIHDRLKRVHSYYAVDSLGFKKSVFHDLFDSFAIDTMSDVDAYIEVRRKLIALCEYALNVSYTPLAIDCNGDSIFIGTRVWYDGDELTVRGYKQEGFIEYLYCASNYFDNPIWLMLDSTITVNKTKDCLQDARDAIRALQDTLQKDVFSKLETVLESLREAQKD